jgi:Kef-type K+ transport system membrane component KefB
MSHLASVLPLAVCVALMGVLAPMALSFLLVPIADFSHQHAFAAGSSLVSTSLGTVLAILHPAAVGFDLHKSKLGATLFSAAILDDVVAFVIAKVLTTVGGGGGSIGAGVGRTVGVTIGLGLVLGALTRFVLRPVYTQWLANKSNNILLCAHVPLFVGLVAAAGYAGTSPLYGAYSAGLAVAYISHNEEKAELSTPETNLITVFEDRIAPLLSTLLLPIFFGSIGFSIPFVALWRGAIIWRGVVYAVFMAFGKLLCSVVILAWMGPSAWRGAVLVGAAMVARGEIGLL